MTEQAMKTLEWIVDCLTVSIDDSKYFGFVPRRGIVCVVWHLQEESLVVRKMLHITVDLEKTFEHIPQEVICWAPRKLNVEKWIALLVLARIGPVFNPILFIILLEALLHTFCFVVPWEDPWGYSDIFIHT